MHGSGSEQWLFRALNINRSDDGDACGWDLSSNTYRWAAPRKGLQGCTLRGDNTGRNIMPSLLGETMPRGSKRSKMGACIQIVASQGRTLCILWR